MLRVVSFNLIFVGFFVAVLELSFGTWFQESHALYKFNKPRDLIVERENPISNEPLTIRYTRDENGFRGVDANVSEIDLITVGGSTTDQRFIDDSQTFQTVIENRFDETGSQIVIANAGIDGQSSFGHIANFKSWFNVVDGLAPKHILFYMGINDTLVLSGKRYDWVEDEKDPGLVEFFKEKSALYQLYRISHQVITRPDLKHAGKETNRANIAHGDHLVSDPSLGEGSLQDPQFLLSLENLQQRVIELAKLSREMGAEPIFVTQRSSAWKIADERIWGIPQIHPGFLSSMANHFGPINGVDVYKIERAVADAILEGCGIAGAHCWDLMGELRFDHSTDYYDAFHTTASGSAAIGNYIFDKMLPLVDQITMNDRP